MDSDPEGGGSQWRAMLGKQLTGTPAAVQTRAEAESPVRLPGERWGARTIMVARRWQRS